MISITSVMLSKKIIAFLVLSTALGYYLYVPVHPGVSRPWKIRGILIAQKMISHAVKLGAWLNVDSRVNLTRNIFDFISHVLPKHDLHGDNGVLVQEQYFDSVRTLTFTPAGYKEKGFGRALVHYHGGGWIFGKPEQSRTLLEHLAKELNVFIVSVDYRLAPEYPYPIPLEDCLRATVQVLSKAQIYGVHPEKVALVGESAGGNLAAAVALKLTNDAQYSKIPKVKFVALFFPVLQAFDFNTPSYQTHRDDLVINVENGIAVWQHYMNGFVERDIIPEVLNNNHTDESIYNALHSKINWNMIPAEYHKTFTEKKPSINHNTKARNVFDKALTDPYVAPLIASDDMLKNFPPTYVLTCEYDVLRDDGIMFKERLLKQFVPVTYMNYQFYHGVTGFIGFGFTESHQSANDFIKFVSANL